MPVLEGPRSSSASTTSTCRTSASSRSSFNSTNKDLELVTMESDDDSGDGKDSDVNAIKNYNIPSTGCSENPGTYTGDGSVVSNEDNCAVVGCDTPNNTTHEQNNHNGHDVTSGHLVCSSDNGTNEQIGVCLSNEDNCHTELMPGEPNVSGTDSEPYHQNVRSVDTESLQPNAVKPALNSDLNQERDTSPNASSVSDTVELVYEKKPKDNTTGNEIMVHPEVHVPADLETQTEPNHTTENIIQSPGDDKLETEGVVDEYEEDMNNEFYEGVSEYIPKDYWKTPLKCLSYGTVTDISYRLDPTDEIEAAPYGKNFTGLCDRLKLDTAFTKYLVKSNIKLKTEEVLSKWEVLKPGEGPRPTIGNFAKIVYYDLDRPDVITDLQEKIVQDAENFEKTTNEASTDRQGDEDRSWELTRHDVATGKVTYYTCCLCYADEDEGMATLIDNFFQTVFGGNTRFFRPQFDLKMGKYTYDSTARVIEERCNGKVIFLLSDYFYANPICQFAVNFAHSRNPAAEQGNLIPFYLTNKYDNAPKVLKGIAGVRWARKQFRYHSWGQLSDCLMTRTDDTNEPSNQNESSKIQERIKVELDSSSSEWLCDPPYDEGTPEPGPALPLNEPPDDPVNSSSSFDPDAVDNSQLVNSDAQNSTKWYRRLMFRVRNALSNVRSPGQNRAPRRSRPIRPEELNKAFVEDRDPPDIV